MKFKNYQIKQTVQFPEQTAVPQEQSENAMFDILQEYVTDNTTYCQSLINKVFELLYAKLPDFFTHHYSLITDPIKWLNKFEKLISDNEQLFTSSAQVKVPLSIAWAGSSADLVSSGSQEFL